MILKKTVGKHDLFIQRFFFNKDFSALYGITI